MVSALQAAREAAREPVSITPKGLDFIRLGIAYALTKEHPHEKADFAAQRWGEKARVTRVLKASVPGITTGTGAGAAMVDTLSVQAEFFDTVRAASVIGRLPLHRVQFQRRTLSMDEGPIVNWRKEGAAYGNSPIKMTNTAGLARYDLGALVVVSQETLMDPSANAELTIRDQLVKSLAAKLDADFLDPANSGVANTKPASVTSGAGSSVSPQESMFDFGDEFQGDPANAWILLNPYQAARLYSAARPDIGARGGTWGGFPVLTSTAVPETQMVLLDPSQIALALGDADIRSSENAMVDMQDSSSMTSGASVAATTGVSMFQVNCLAIIGEHQHKLARHARRCGHALPLAGLWLGRRIVGGAPMEWSPPPDSPAAILDETEHLKRIAADLQAYEPPPKRTPAPELVTRKELDARFEKICGNTLSVCQKLLRRIEALEAKA